MTVTLAQTRIRPDDQNWQVEMIGTNYAANRVVVRVRYQSGDSEDIVFEGSALLAMRQAVPNFAGLRPAMETYIASIRPDLAGVQS